MFSSPVFRVTRIIQFLILLLDGEPCVPFCAFGFILKYHHHLVMPTVLGTVWLWFSILHILFQKAHQVLSPFQLSRTGSLGALTCTPFRQMIVMVNWLGFRMLLSANYIP
jgi:hypothetical protein